MEELKPCPFCGGEAKYEQSIGNECSFLSLVRCLKCDAHTSAVFGYSLSETKKNAAALWNTRTERTCKNLYCESSTLGEGGFRCSLCDGEMFGDAPKYCCHCGAKVVS